MSSMPLAACLPQKLYGESGLFPQNAELEEYENMADTAVIAEDNSIVFDPIHMNIGQYYLAVIDEMPYLYRRINDQEIEVHGMARKD